MEKDFWLKVWTDGKINFHKATYNEFLEEHFSKLNMGSGDVFVPLCGKTKDLFRLSPEEFERHYGQAQIPSELAVTNVAWTPDRLKGVFNAQIRNHGDTLEVRSDREDRPQAAYFPNDRVRVGLLANEAEILAAIRNGSTNQVFNQPPVVKP